ncbi:short coiled-coil protein A isoform X1 [Athalia rosae]|nr:short coiled-coil protein A isoform X1 [Athalia rosae]
MSTSMISGAKLQDDMNSIPLADDDPQVIIPEEELPDNMSHLSDVLVHGRSMDSIPSTFTNGSSSPNTLSFHNYRLGLDPDISPDEQEEKARLIAQVLELQNTLDDLSQRVDSVKEENLKLRSENQVLGQYIENLMSASSVFQSTSPKSKKK